MENAVDWRMISVCFQLIQFIFMAIIFAVLKFNDMKHLDEDVTGLKKDFQNERLKNDERHIENIKAIGDLSGKVSELVGRCHSIHSKDK